MPLIQRLFRFYFGIVGRIFPRFVSKTLWKLVFTPRKNPFKAHHQECLSQSVQFKLTVPDYYHPGKSISLNAYEWGKGDNYILMVHGWDAKALDYFVLIPELVRDGFKVVSFDGPAHGQSEGIQSNLVDFKNVIHEVTLKLGTPYAIIGHSMGGAAAAFALIDFPIKIEKLVLVAVPIVSRNFFERIFKELTVSEKVIKQFYADLYQHFGTPVDTYNLKEKHALIKAGKIMAIFDKHDEVIYFKDADEFIQKASKIESLVTERLSHYTLIRESTVIKSIRLFLNSK